MNVRRGRQQFGLFIKPEARDFTCTPTLAQPALPHILGNLIKVLKQLGAVW